MATRFSLPYDTAPAVSPTISGTDWPHTQTTRRVLNDPKGSSTITSVVYTPDAGDHLVDSNAHFIQFVSGEYTARTIAGQTVRLVARFSEGHANNNLFLTYKLYIVNTAGDSVLATLAAITRTSASEFATALTNRKAEFTISETALAESFRIVLELGWGGLPTAAAGTQGHNATCSIGENATDVLFDDTSTTAGAPWLEFVTGIADIAGGGGGQPPRTMHQARMRRQ